MPSLIAKKVALIVGSCRTRHLESAPYRTGDFQRSVEKAARGRFNLLDEELNSGLEPTLPMMQMAKDHEVTPQDLSG